MERSHVISLLAPAFGLGLGRVSFRLDDDTMKRWRDAAGEVPMRRWFANRAGCILLKPGETVSEAIRRELDRVLDESSR